jgi:hypothetical protein
VGALLTCVSAQGRTIQTNVDSLVGPDLRERTRADGIQWIKRLRLARYGSLSMRERFTYRGDSLWWFTELYLHKMRRVEKAVATVLALEAACERHAPASLVLDEADEVTAEVAGAFGRTHRIGIDIRTRRPPRAASAWQSYLIGLTSRISRWRPGRREVPPRRPVVAAFVHTAFWRSADPQHEAYIGPVLDALARRTQAGDLVFVGVGPRRNFRSRRWWDVVTPAVAGETPVVAIEQLASRDALQPSIEFWRRRDELARDIVSGGDIRAAAEFRGCDLWPVLRAELETVARLQWPWSARSMDEAGAALDVLGAEVVLTYAEAGGWGRALVLEARRRRVASVGLQHGFIYRHWLNYLHEPDEIAASSTDPGCPLPDRTLVYDRYAAEHLIHDGHFPAEGVVITGSARLEDLARRVDQLCRDRATIRQRLGVPSDRPLAVLAAKFSEIRHVLPALVSAAGTLPDVQLAIKPHPAETAAVYAPLTHGRDRILVLPADVDLAAALASCDGLVTMNSTVAIDGLVLGVPALVVGLPNNLSPFVSAGVMLGAVAPEEIAPQMQRLLYDRKVRHDLRDAAEAFSRRHGLAPAPGAAARAADVVLGLRHAGVGRPPSGAQPAAQSSRDS